MISDTQRIQSLKEKLRSTQNMLEMMKKSCTPEELESLQKLWMEPIEKEIEEMEKGSK